MKVVVKCPKCQQVVTFEGYTENAQCSNCQAQLKINYDDLAMQRNRIKKLTVLLNIPALIIAFIAYILGARIGYIAAAILLYQVIWVTVHRSWNLKKLQQK